MATRLMLVLVSQARLPIMFQTGFFREQVEQDEGEGAEGAGDIHTGEEHNAHQGEGDGDQHRSGLPGGWYGMLRNTQNPRRP